MFAGAFKKRKMKRLICVLCLVGAVQFAFSQSGEMAEGDSIPWEIRKQSFIYNTAKLFNDPAVTKMALYNLISENPANPALYDSLALIYLQYQQFASAALVAQQSIKLNNQNMFATEVAATSLDNLGAKDKAIPYYEALYLSNNDINTLYKIAFLQMEVERYGESVTSIDIIMGNEESKESFIVFPTEDGKGQEVPLNVCAHRIKAMIEEKKGNEDEAKKLYLATLEMYPGFQVVQSQLQSVGKEAEN